jgi:hypothetical protein
MQENMKSKETIIINKTDFRENFIWVRKVHPAGTGKERTRENTSLPRNLAQEPTFSNQGLPSSHRHERHSVTHQNVSLHSVLFIETL